MKFAAERRYADPEKAARKLIKIIAPQFSRFEVPKIRAISGAAWGGAELFA